MRHQLIEFGGGAGSACSPAACHRECECECDVPARCEAATGKGPTGAEARAPRHAGRLRLACRAPTHTHTHSLSFSLSLSLSLSVRRYAAVAAVGPMVACMQWTAPVHVMLAARALQEVRRDVQDSGSGWPTASFAWTSGAHSVASRVCCVHYTPQSTLPANDSQG